jgi:hypothetical protein
MEDPIMDMLVRLIVPDELLKSFTVSNFKEWGDRFEIILTEKEYLIPEALKGKPVVMDGYWNALELQTFPQKGKACFLKLIRRKWKESGGTKGYGNSYHYNSDGTKATEDFGAFLKEHLG